MGLACDFRNEYSVLRTRKIRFAVSIEEEVAVDISVHAIVMHFTKLELNFVTRRKRDFEQMSALRVELTV